MSDNIKIAFDVDGVLALETPLLWGLATFENFINRLSEFKRYECFGNAIKNNDRLLVKQDEAYDWWKNQQLYDNLQLHPIIKSMIDYFQSRYPEAEWFVLSDCFEEHIVSKIEFCRKYLPFDKFEFFNIKEKFTKKCNIYIDDKPKNLIDCKKHWKDECLTVLVKHFYNDVNEVELQYIDCIEEIPLELELSLSKF